MSPTRCIDDDVNADIVLLALDLHHGDCKDLVDLVGCNVQVHTFVPYERVQQMCAISCEHCEHSNK